MPRDPRATPLSRRLLLAGGAGGAALALTGCDALDDLLGGDDDPGVSGAITPTAPPADADSTLVDQLLEAIAVTGLLATSTAATYPALATLGTRLARLHDAHATELGAPATGPTVSPTLAPAVADTRPGARRALVEAEETLQNQLVTAAQEARSGALAQTLASMAAAVAQVRTTIG